MDDTAADSAYAEEVAYPNTRDRRHADRLPARKIAANRAWPHRPPDRRPARRPSVLAGLLTIVVVFALLVPGGLGLMFAVRLAGIYASIGDGRVLAAEGLAERRAQAVLLARISPFHYWIVDSLDAALAGIVAREPALASLIARVDGSDTRREPITPGMQY